MKITTKIETKRIKEFFKKIPRAIGKHFFLSFLFVVFLALVFGGLVLYQYVFLAESIEFNVPERPVFFDEDTYKKVLESWQAREKKIQEIESKQYSNPFSIPPTPSL
jgi:hypothetical protein